jgi:His/Glu/Gln/Arg/opine family amino acid ABC transporter permease subunit
MDFTSIWKYLPALFSAMGMTLYVTFLSILIGTVIGIALALLRLTRKPLFSAPVIAYIEFFRTTPFLVQVMWIYFVFPYITKIDLNAFTAGVMALSLNTGAFMAEIFRAGLQSVDKGQKDACRVLGLSKWHTFSTVIFSQAFRTIFPPFSTNIILILKASSQLAVIAVLELTYTAGLIAQVNGRYLEIFTVVACFYFAVIYPLKIIFTRIEVKLNPDRQQFKKA